MSTVTIFLMDKVTLDVAGLKTKADNWTDT